ncbi:MAG: ATP synthase F1 subunit gamma [Vicingaceae bacterium]
MANLKEIRNRITSVSSTMQITSAMKMVSASKLRRAQDAIQQLRPYAAKLNEIMGNLSGSISSEGLFTQKRDGDQLLIITVSSNRGLCGAFNSNVIKETRRLIEEHKQSKQITVLSIGKKAEDYFKKTDYGIGGTTLPKNLSSVYDNLNFDYVSEIAKKIITAYGSKQFDEILLVYNEFKNAAVQNVISENFLPILPPPEDTSATKSGDYIFEPDKELIVEEMIPKSLKIQLYKAILDSYAAEHGARMTAMHKATDNASELIKELKLSYNKARQAAITGEILEIVAGAEALN